MDGKELNQVKFEIKESLKKHYLFESPINDLLDCFIMVFNAEKKELIRRFGKQLDSIYGDYKFSDTVFNISDMIVFRYFNDELSFIEKCFITSNKFNQYPFAKKIIEINNG